MKGKLPGLMGLLIVAAAVVPARLKAQMVAGYEGAAALGLELRRLSTSHRVLMIGAHPDDENTAVLAALALGAGADVAYLSLTRGEGGQNGIGPELQEGLGLIRTDELLAARRLDGAAQYFTRAYDFGFSKAADEAFAFWQRDSVLADVVATIRRFRPDVILSIWSGTPQDGHGHHQAAGILAREAFEAAADSTRFPGQLTHGLRPHRARYLFQASWRARANAPIQLKTGEYDPLFGASWHQIAMASRSLHRSQGQGSAREPGPHSVGMLPMDGEIPAGATSIFEGIDSSLAAAAATWPDVAVLLEAFERHVAEALRAFNPLRPAGILLPLQRALAALEEADARAAGLEGTAELRFRIAAEHAHAVEALRLAAGITLDVTLDDGRLVPGDTAVMTVRIWNGGPAAERIDDLYALVPDGWTATSVTDAAGEIAPGTMVTEKFTIRVAETAAPSQPYFLRSPRNGALYQWPADVTLRGEPFDLPPLQALARLRIGDRTIELHGPATFVEVDPALGESRLPVLIVPAVSVRVEPEQLVLPLAENGEGTQHPLDVTVTLRSESRSPVAGTVRLQAPEGWQVRPESAAVRLAGEEDRQTLRFQVTAPPDTKAGRFFLDAVLEGEGRRASIGYDIIDYPHTPPRLLLRDARAGISAFPVTVTPGLRVGYIEGAGDAGPDALARLGIAVESLTRDSLLAGDLSRYDVIIAGIRAWEVRPDLAAANRRILDWVEAGGTFIVQYQRQDFANGGFTPYRLAMPPSAPRVTDETAPVRFLEPDHPILARPNRLGLADFEGWVQERGLYFMSEWDDRFTPLLEMNDPGEPPRRGSLLVARYGRGHYVYVALSLFRQLPAGVPGAYRLLANLVALGAQ